jgi:MFS family permease
MPLADAQAVVAPQHESLARRVLFFGWTTIVVGALAMAATYPGRTHGFGMVTEPLLTDLGLSHPAGRVLYASLNLWGTLIGALFCLPVGWLFDRCDRRWILAGDLVLLGVSVAWKSRITSSQQLFAALILTRGLGQSALSVVSITIVAKAFDSQRLGLAMGWYAVLSAPFHLVLIKSVGWALTDAGYSWREVWQAVGWSLVALSLTAALLRGRPMPHRQTPPGIDLAGSTLAQALRTPAFWVFGLTISLWGMIYSGVSLFNVDIFRERGFDEKLYFNVLALVSLVALASKMLFGWLVNYVPLTRLLAACLLVTALCLYGLPIATRTWHAYLYGVGLGIASGAVALLFFASWGKLYGQRALGRIQGVAQMLTVFASACGPLVFSYGKLSTASYTLVFELMATLVLAMAVAAWFTPLPRSLEPIQESCDVPLADSSHGADAHLAECVES